jgi:hydroxymethylbilane synthase
MLSPLRIGTRGSRLALWQANYVAARLQPLAGGRAIELVEILTAGDQVRDVPLAQIGGEGVFTKEIQRALLDATVDVAVHSLKDLPTLAVHGLTLAAVPLRGSVGDVMISRRHASLDGLPPGAVVATSSLRRRAQLLHRRPDLKLVPIRGNVETRLRKLTEEGLDALILAQAGLERLALAEQITEVLDPAWMLPAVGQGALGLECRAEDTSTLQLLAELDHAPTRYAVFAERALLRGLGGGCQVPIGAMSRHEGNLLALRGVVLDPEGKVRLEAQLMDSAEKAEDLGYRLARELLERGAHWLLGGSA